MFSLGEDEEPVPVEVPQIPGCCSGGLPSHIQKVGAKNRAGEGSTLPRLAFALTTGFTLDTCMFPVRAWDLSRRLQ